METKEDVNKALGIMAGLKVEIMDAEVVMNEAINKAKAKADKTITPLQTRYESLEEDIESWCKANKADFAKKRTLKLLHGEISYRVSKKIVLQAAAKVVLDSLKALGLTDYIRIKEEPDKDAMKAMSDIDLAKVGAARVPDDKITIKPDLEKVEVEA